MLDSLEGAKFLRLSHKKKTLCGMCQERELKSSLIIINIIKIVKVKLFLVPSKRSLTLTRFMDIEVKEKVAFRLFFDISLKRISLNCQSVGKFRGSRFSASHEKLNFFCFGFCDAI
jgi:hypothetical protein